MVPAQRNDALRLAPHPRHEPLVAGRLVVDARARLAELLPDEDPEAVTRRVERLGLDEPAAPDPDQVRVARRNEAEQVLEPIRPRDAVKRVERRPVPAEDLELLIVHEERPWPGGGRRAVVRDPLDPAEPDPERSLIE